MKKINSLFVLSLGVALVLSSCGGASMKDNTYLGQLPSISNKYQDMGDEYKEKAKKATDMDDAFKYDKEYKLAKEEGKKVVKEYLEANKLDTPIPFEEYSDSRFTIVSLSVDGASVKRVNFVATVKMKEDVKNKYGGFEKYIFAYLKAVDSEGNAIGKPSVLASPMGGKVPKFEKDVEVEVKGSLSNLREFEDFDKVVFISKGEYEKTK
ncbi:MAG: hypothetical protein KAG64_04105 [Bacteroidales bacterium]|nr:hypothetical protein [Bacteroidales bacterium]